MKLGPKDFETICTLVGQIVVPFAILEASLNAIVEATHNSLGGNTLQKKLPDGFGMRKVYLEKCLLKLPSLDNVKVELQKLLDDSLAESTTRNAVVHGFVSDFDANTNTFTFKSLEAKTNKLMHTEKVDHFTAQQLIDCGDRLLNLAVWMNEMASRLIQ